MGSESGPPRTGAGGEGGRDLTRISARRQTATAPQRKDPSDPQCGSGAPAPGTRECCGEAEAPGPARKGSPLVHSSPGEREPWIPQPQDPPPPLPTPSRTSAPGSGVRKSASSRAPLRTGSGRSASTSSMRSAAESSWRRLPGNPTPRPGLGAPPPTGCMPRGPPGGGGAGAHPVAAAHASRNAGPSGQRHPVARDAHYARPPHHLVNDSQTRFQIAITWGSFKTSEV